MQNNSRREIIQRIAAAEKGRLPFVNKSVEESVEIYKPILPDIVTCFKNELEAINGQCILCEDELDLYTKLNVFFISKISHIFFAAIPIFQVNWRNMEFHFQTMKLILNPCKPE